MQHTPEIHGAVMFCLSKILFITKKNYARQNSTAFYMTLNDSNVSAENVTKSCITLFSRSLIQINEVFDK